MVPKSLKENNVTTPIPASIKGNYYDLTAPITSNTVVYPGDPRFSIDDVASLAEGARFQLCHMHLGNHTGTHIDFPAHVIPGGKTSSDLSFRSLI